MQPASHEGDNKRADTVLLSSRTKGIPPTSTILHHCFDPAVDHMF